MLARAAAVAFLIAAPVEAAPLRIPSGAASAATAAVERPGARKTAASASASSPRRAAVPVTPHRGRRTAVAAPPAPPASPPKVKLTISAPAPASGWSLQVVNEGAVPVRILADARLLALDVTPPGARRALRCALPPAMLPADDLERAMVLSPGRAFHEKFEPRLYCFGPRGFDALAPGAIVVGRLGPRGAGTRGASPGPQEVSPIDDVTPVAEPVPVLQAPPVALPDERPAPEADGRSRPAEPVIDVPRLKLQSPAAVDAASPEEVAIPVTLRNESSVPVTIRFRPETIGFEVTSSASSQHCHWPVLPSAPTPELFTTLPADHSVTLTLLLQSYCAGALFARSGLLSVRPFLETFGTSGAPLGLRTFEGRVVGSSVTFVRLQRGVAIQPLVAPHEQSPW